MSANNQEIEWRYENKDWNNNNIPIPKEIEYKIVKITRRHTVIKVNISHFATLNQVMRDRKDALKNGITQPLEKLASDVSNPQNS
jgi:hypothetical protein